MLLLVATASPAAAQVGPSIGGAQGAGLPNYGSGLPTRHNPNDDESGGSKSEPKPKEPPAAIPGAVPNPDAAVIPADKVAAEMSPNDALFDAINRGDLVAAKDAVSRGAQLEAHNVLGQTPTDAAIDLNRNDITFLLLSMRGAVSSSRPAVQQAAVQQAAAQQAAARVKGARRGKAVPAAAKVLANNRGVPNPSVGFNGF